MNQTTTALIGPAEADHYRVKVGRSRWYYDPLPADETWSATDWQGPSVSATKPPFANKYVPMRTIAEMSDEEWARMSTIDADARYEQIKSVEKTAGFVNMDRGTIVHMWAEDLLAGRLLREPYGYKQAAAEAALQYRPALQAFFDDYQPRPVAVEVPCLHRTLNGVGYGGTADVLADLGSSGTWWIDWKSRKGEHGAYVEEAAQGGAYGGAEYMITVGADGNPQRSPIPAADGVLIVSLTTDGYRCYPIELDVAVSTYSAMHGWWVAQREAKFGKAFAPKPVQPAPTVEAAAVSDWLKI